MWQGAFVCTSVFSVVRVCVCVCVCVCACVRVGGYVFECVYLLLCVYV